MLDFLFMLIYNTVPISTEYLSSERILKFRDGAYTEYHTWQSFLDKVQKYFGVVAVNNIRKMAKIKLKRKISQEFNYY